MMDALVRRPYASRPFVVLPATLGWYVGRRTLAAIFTVAFAFAVLAFMIDLIEQLRSAADDGSWLLAVQLAGLRVPNLLDRIWPFAVLFGAMLAFWRLNRSQELVAIRAAGVSAWQFLAPACLAAALLGTLVVALFNPISAALTARYERLEAGTSATDDAQVAVFAGGVWLRLVAADRRYVMSGERLRAGQTVILERATVFVYDADGGDYLYRLDAPGARLGDGAWILEGARRSDTQRLGAPVGTVEIATELRPETIRRSFRTPETLSFWELRGYAKLIEDLGFSALEHRVHWHSLTAIPVLFTAMLLLGVTFTLRFRRSGSGRLLPLGLIGGFAFFILVDVVKALGMSGQLPPMLAAWTPSIIALMLGSAAMFQLEDG